MPYRRYTEYDIGPDAPARCLSGGSASGPPPPYGRGYYYYVRTYAYGKHNLYKQYGVIDNGYLVNDICAKHCYFVGIVLGTG
jgi:hypothetical protein